MVVILRVVERTDRRVGGGQAALWRVGRLGGVEVHVRPLQLTRVLYLAGDRVDACRNAQAAAEGHEEDVARVGVGHAAPPDARRHHWDTLRVQLVGDADVLFYPSDQELRVAFGLFRQFGVEFLLENGPVGGEEFVRHARIEYVLGEERVLLGAHVVQMVAQDARGRVAQVFGGDGVEQVDSHRPSVGGRLAQEAFDFLPVAASGRWRFSAQPCPALWRGRRLSLGCRRSRRIGCGWNLPDAGAGRWRLSARRLLRRGWSRLRAGRCRGRCSRCVLAACQA